MVCHAALCSDAFSVVGGCDVGALGAPEQATVKQAAALMRRRTECAHNRHAFTPAKYSLQPPTPSEDTNTDQKCHMTGH